MSTGTQSTSPATGAFTRARSTYDRRRRRAPFMRHAILIAWALFVLFPIYWMLQTSFKDAGEWVTWPPHWYPHEPTLHNYLQIFQFSDSGKTLARNATEQAFSIWKALGDSLIVCTISSLLSLLLGSLLAYSISR
ncbi:MAG: hypothetical protein IT538_02750, partial [Variibacter sp.]|nr:hypothetical protein [Variibacter sp.]